MKHLSDIASVDVELNDLAHIDLVVTGADRDFSLNRVGQDSTGQAAWQDQYFAGLSYDSPCPREQVVGLYSEFRVCFYLHYFRLDEAIVTPYGNLRASSIGDPPRALMRSHPYDYPWP
ncbi:MAG: hypothetical protein WCH40_12515 [Verrucomicrobiales bacterium]